MLPIAPRRSLVSPVESRLQLVVALEFRDLRVMRPPVLENHLAQSVRVVHRRPPV